MATRKPLLMKTMKVNKKIIIPISVGAGLSIGALGAVALTKKLKGGGNNE